jgi:hypothetical protein
MYELEEFVVVQKIPGTDNDFEPVHPGHMSEADAKRLKHALNVSGIPCAIWTHDRWNRHQDSYIPETSYGLEY